MTLSDSSSDSSDDDESIRSHVSKKQSKSMNDNMLPTKKRRRRTIESDGFSDDGSHAEEKPRSGSLALKKKVSKRTKQEDSINNDDLNDATTSNINTTSSSKKRSINTSTTTTTTNDHHQTNAPKRKREGGYSSQRVTSSYGGAFNGKVPTPKHLSKLELKPKLQVNDSVYAAWWPDEESKRTNSQSSWYEGRVKSVQAVDNNQGSSYYEYGPTYYYSIEYDDGDELDQVRDVYVWPKADYLLCMKRKQQTWIGVKGVQDKSVTKDKWAKVTGWYVAEINGVEYPFSLLSGKNVDRLYTMS